METSLIILLVLAVVVTHLLWRRRFAQYQRRAEAELESLRRRQTEAELRALGQQQALFNSMVEGVLLLDAAGRIQLANDTFGTLFGLTGDLRGRPLLEAVRSHELADLVERLEREPTIRSVELRLNSGEERWIEVNAAALRDVGDHAVGIVLVFHDLTRLKRLERTRQEFVANVSHELRTPLSLIKGFIESLLDGAKNDPALNEKFLRIIDRNAQRLALLIEDLLTISQLESGRTQLELRPVNLPLLVAEVLEEFQSPAAARQVTLSADLPPVTVSADPNRLHQVFSNLIDNAIKYGRPGGRVHVGAQTVSTSEIQIEVADNGPGLPPEAVNRVFERFYRVDKARSREEGGTGLGLSIVKHIVQAHGGRVWAESEPDSGARFCFTLATPEAAPGQKVAAAIPPPLSNI